MILTLHRKPAGNDLGCSPRAPRIIKNIDGAIKEIGKPLVEQAVLTGMNLDHQSATFEFRTDVRFKVCIVYLKDSIKMVSLAEKEAGMPDARLTILPCSILTPVLAEPADNPTLILDRMGDGNQSLDVKFLKTEVRTGLIEAVAIPNLFAIRISAKDDAKGPCIDAEIHSIALPQSIYLVVQGVGASGYEIRR